MQVLYETAKKQGVNCYIFCPCMSDYRRNLDF
jgi:hypothetical protein